MLLPLSISLFFLVLLLSIPLSLQALDGPPSPPPRGYYINCGSPEPKLIDRIQWINDDGLIGVGNASQLDASEIMPVLSNLRYFPDSSARKNCYTIPVAKGAKYLVRTTYYYGGFDGGSEPPVFDQIIGGTKWSMVNTTENYAKGLTSYYEIIVVAQGKEISVCFARNKYTVSSPFISALEVVYLEESMYNTTGLRRNALVTIARHRFGNNGQIMRYPDDPFDRYWEAFTDANPVVESQTKILSSDFWNLPPEMALERALTTSRGKSLTLQWPAMALPETNYYLALYFQDNRTPSPYSWRVFDVMVNGQSFYTSLNVSTKGVMVYGNWPLSGQTMITLTPDEGSPVGPVISAGEILQIVPLGGRTRTSDVIAMESMARSFTNPPSDWTGDPCLPRENSWTGVTCSQGKFARVVALNLTNFGLSGSLSQRIGKLTAITSIWLGGNKLSGPIPDMSPLRQLVSLHLENNKLSGSVPPSFGNLENLQELFLQNNNLQDRLPDSLKQRRGINIQISPGNKMD